MFLQGTYGFYQYSDTLYVLSSYSLIMKVFSKIKNYKKVYDIKFKNWKRFGKEFSKIIFPMVDVPTISLLNIQSSLFSILRIETEKYLHCPFAQSELQYLHWNDKSLFLFPFSSRNRKDISGCVRLVTDRCLHHHLSYPTILILIDHITVHMTLKL